MLMLLCLILVVVVFFVIVVIVVVVVVLGGAVAVVVVVVDVVAATEVMQQSFLSSRKKAFTEKFRKTDDSCKKNLRPVRIFFTGTTFSGFGSVGTKMLRLIDQVRYSMGSGCSTAV